MILKSDEIYVETAFVFFSKRNTYGFVALYAAYKFLFESNAKPRA